MAEVGRGTQVKVNIVSSPGFKWELNIDSFRGKKLGEKVVSPTFSYENDDGTTEKWLLELYPKRQCADNCKKGFVSVVLKSLNESAVTRAYVISLLDQDGNKHYPLIASDTFDNDNLGYSFDFFEKKFIDDPRNNVLKDGNFTVFLYIVDEDRAVVDSDAAVAAPNLALPQSSGSSEALEKLFDTGAFSDWRVTCQRRELKLHRCVLATSDTEFSKIFRLDVKHEREVAPQDFLNARFEVLKEFFRFIYTGRANNIGDMAFELWALAQKYKVQGLKAICEEKMTAGDLNFELNIENAVDCLKLGIDKNLEQLKLKVTTFVAVNYKEFIRRGLHKKIGDIRPRLFEDIMSIALELEAEEAN